MGMLLANLAFALCAVVGLAVAGRLLLVARRTRQAPELVFGCATLSQALSAIGFGLVPIVLPQSAIFFGTSAMLCMETAGTLAVAAGCWLIFRRGEGAARTAAILLSLFALAMTAVRLGLADPAAATAAGPLGHGEHFALAQSLTNSAVALAYGWMAFEAVRYGLQMRRRLQLGLDHPMVVHQFLLWGLASAVIVLINLGVIATVQLTGKPAETVAWAHGSIAAGGLVGAAALWLAFFPSRVHRAWAERLHEARG